MRWQRRKNIWPYRAALSGLFLLSLFVPRSWQRLQHQEARHQPISQRKAVHRGDGQAVQAEPLKEVVRLEAERVVDPLTSPSPHAMVPPELPPATEAHIGQPAAIVFAEDYLLEEDTVKPDPYLLEPNLPALVIPAVSEEVVSESLPATENRQLGALLSIRDALAALVKQASSQLSNWAPPQPVALKDPPKKNVADKFEPTEPTEPLTSMAARWGAEEAGPEAGPVLSPPAQPTLLKMIPERSTARDTPDGTDDIPARVSDRRQSRRQSSISVLPPLRISNKTTPISPAPKGASPIALPRGIPARPTPPMTPWLVCRPVALLDCLRQLEDSRQASNRPSDRLAAANWAHEVRARIERLTGHTQRAEDASAVVTQLQHLAIQVENGAIHDNRAPVYLDWLRAGRALQRRLGVWQLLASSRDTTLPGYTPPSDEPTMDRYLALQQVSRQFAQLTANSTAGAAWCEYLLLDSILDMAHGVAANDRQWQRLLAQQVLARVSDSRLTSAQQKFLASEPMLSLQHQLHWWATGPVDLQRLAVWIEGYEQTGRSDLGQRISQYQQRLKWSSDASQKKLADQLDQHYRNANVRIVLTDELLNRMLPKQKPTVRPVHDWVVGTEVRGHARTSTEVRVRLLPDSHAWRFALGARGDIHSRTYTETWPARIHNKGKLRYETNKGIVLETNGLKVAPATAHANGRNRLVEVETPLDRVPLINSLLHRWVRSQHRKTEPRALAHVKSKTARTARQQMDQRVDPKLQQLAQRFRETVLFHLESLALIAEPMELYTTRQQAVMRLRLAQGNQLAAHSLRPPTPSDSWVSLQVHNSALNNSLAGFELDGRRLSVGQLFDLVTEKLRWTDVERPDDLPDRALVEFASHDAIRVDCQDGRLELVLSIRELAHGRDKIRNFQVHAYFRPELHGLQVALVRDGTLQFSGRRLRTGPRMVLHSVFGKLLRKDQQFLLLGEKIEQDPRLDRMMLTQLILDHGWIGAAWGLKDPGRVARR